MAIPQHTIDQILDRTDIVDLIGQRVKLKKSGRTYSGCCPFHQEKSPSFHVYRDKQYFHCFGCQANGNAIRFLMDIDSRSFIDVMKDLSSQTGIELPKDNRDSKKLVYKREAKPVQKPQVDVAEAKKAEPAPVVAEVCNDEDSDGVCDNLDKCPGTEANATVDADGCVVVAEAVRVELDVKFDFDNLHG